MKLAIKLTPFSIFLLTVYAITAQTNFNSLNIIKGTVIDDSTGLIIPNAHIFNESKRNWYFSDEDGYFSIWTDSGDTLVFSAMGYFSLVLFLNDSLIQSDITVKLEPRAYEIREVTVRPYDYYKQFKNDFVNLNLPRTALDSITEELTILSKNVAIKSDYEGQVKRDLVNFKGDFFHTSIPLRTKKDKQKKAFTKKLKAEEHRNEIERKYNRDIVSNITKLKDNDLSDFIFFCNFSDEFLLNANEYEIIKIICEKFDEYKKANQ